LALPVSNSRNWKPCYGYSAFPFVAGARLLHNHKNEAQFILCACQRLQEQWKAFGLTKDKATLPEEIT